MQALLDLAGSVLRPLGLLSDECFFTMIVTQDFTNGPCLKALVSKGLGIAMTVTSAIVKSPQIFNMLKLKSAVGVSAASLYLETIMYSCSAVYGIVAGNDFATYGENVTLIAQNLVIVLLMWRFSKCSLVEIGTAILVFVGFWLMALNLPADCGLFEACLAAAKSGGAGLAEACTGVKPCQTMLISSTVPIMLSSRVPQILTNFKLGHTGVLSPITLSMNLLGSAIRIFTTIQDVGFDFGMLSSFACSVAVNFCLVMQCIMYSKKTKEVLAAAAAKKAKDA